MVEGRSSTDAFSRHFDAMHMRVFEIYAMDYSTLSEVFWGMPCAAVVFAERLNFKLAVILQKFTNVTVRFAASKGVPPQIHRSSQT